MALSRRFARLGSSVRPFSSSSAIAGGSGGTKTLEVDNPYTGEVYAEIPLARAAEAEAIVTAASVAQKEWRETSIEHRMEVCSKFVEITQANKEAIAKDITGQMGKPLSQALGEVDGLAERSRAMIELAPSVLAEQTLGPHPGIPGLVRKIAKEPVGVVLIAAPWNYALLTTANSLIPAILAGNSVVLKMSSRTPLCADALASAFEAAGAPAGLVTPLHCGHSVVPTVIDDPRVNYVAFTGSVDGGHSVYRSIAKHRFIPATLELGGKDPAYVREDADLAHAVDTIVDGGFYNAGQSCCGIERVYVHSSLYDEFITAALAKVQAYKLGDPMDPSTTMGPLAQASAVDFLQEQVDEAVSNGARLLCGGKGTTDEAGHGRFFAPTLLADCDHSMSIMLEESFGPVLGVMPVDDDEEAIQLMNDSPYGLTAAVFSSDVDRVQEIGARIETGTVFMNRCDYLDPLLPWTGVKDTGMGVSLSEHGFRGVTRLKGYNLKTKL